MRLLKHESTLEMTDSETVAFYQRRYRLSIFIKWILRHDNILLENARNRYWYTCGLYDELGYDRQGRSYVTVEDDRDSDGAQEYVAYRRDVNENYDRKQAR